VEYHKIFLFDPRLQKVPVLSLNFEMYLNAEVSTFHHIDSLKEKLDQDIRPKVFIVHKSLCVSDIINLVKDIEGVELISLGEPKEEFENLEILDEHITIQDLLRNLAPRLNVTASQMASLKYDQYMAIPHNFFSRLIFSPCDLFLKDEGEITLALPAGKSISEDFLAALNEDSEVFIESIQRLSFTNSFTDQFAKMSNLLTDFAIDIDQKTERLEQVMSFVARDFKNGGMQPESIQIAESCIKTIIDTPMSSPLLHKLKENMISRSVTIRSVISFAIAFMGNHVVDSLDWILENPKDDIATAAFFHDLILEDEDQLRVGSQEELEALGLNAEKKQIVNEHPRLIWTVLRGVPSLSDQAKQLVKEHHGSTRGVGFLTDLDKLKPLSKIFLVSNYWAYMVYGQSEGTLSNDQIGEKLKSTFPGQDYLEIINSILILNIETVDDLMAYLAKSDSEEEEAVTNLGKDLVELEEIIKVSGDGIDEEAQEDLSAIGFYAEKANHLLVKGGNELEEEDAEVLKGITDALSEVNQLVKGNPSEEDKTKYIVKGGEDGKLKELRHKISGNASKLDDIKKRTLDIKKSSVTDLMLAAMKGSLELCKIFLEEDKTTLNRTDGEGRAAIHFAAIGGNINVCQYLLDNGAKLNHLDGKRRNPIFFTIVKNHSACFDYFIDNNARVNQQSVGGVNLAMTAAKYGRADMLHRVLGKGVPVSAKDTNGKGIRDYAKKNKEILAVLEKFSG
jgi:hypothetical protein